MPHTAVLLVDDQPLFIKGLSSLINGLPSYTVIGEARDCVEAMALLSSKKPVLAVTELDIGNKEGLDLIKDMKSYDPGIVVLVLSKHDERYYAERALRAGARGYIMKSQPETMVVSAIKTVMAGKVYLSDAERERLFEYMTGEPLKEGDDWFSSIRKLSDRQFQIFTLIAHGFGTIEIADRLNLSPKTIDTHKEYLKLRLHCTSSRELKQLAIGWIRSPPPP
ncbi:MAG: response regulator transcription factor, partial [Spirochaetaceae bacterium]|nr:response regulator transcription factor [Spirochaetaceae bacterium]